MYRLFKEQELVEYLNGAFSLSWIRHCRLTGKGIPFLKIGHAVRYRQSDVDAWLASQKLCSKTSEYVIMQDLELPEVLRAEMALAEQIKQDLELPEVLRAEMALAKQIKQDLEPPEAVNAEMEFARRTKQEMEPSEL